MSFCIVHFSYSLSLTHSPTDSPSSNIFDKNTQQNFTVLQPQLFLNHLLNALFRLEKISPSSSNNKTHIFQCLYVTPKTYMKTENNNKSQKQHQKTLPAIFLYCFFHRIWSFSFCWLTDTTTSANYLNYCAMQTMPQQQQLAPNP